ncbi:6-phosphofructokinase [Massilia sp. Leaf139]|uniref:6-phosphofructokinase n=1 Tax=Massilia sp. Leaf139 TaxID=1736272 RepID=UPI0006F9278F|nr:ATP-dependent 6-phosphofructokinase [Massilia sp. Leaf139]KQQ97510.1 6-phosphofructokinase [Massilia sp. Leaf139]
MSAHPQLKSTSGAQAEAAPVRRIGLLTGGGDAPGLNGVIRAVVLAATRLGWECHGIRDGFNGLLAPETCIGPPVQRLGAVDVHAIGHLGGTILGTTNRGNPLRYPGRGADGAPVETDRSGEVVALCRARGLDALVVVGGDGSMGIAQALHAQGLRVVGVPKTIDNDLDRTFSTFGFDTAVGFATDCIDRLHTTAHSQHRVMVVEVMGRYAGWIALHAGIAGGAHVILLPELPYRVEAIAAAIAQREAAGHHHAIVVVAEGAQPVGGERAVQAGAEAGRAERLGGIGARLEAELAAATGKECRSVVLGHLLRGGSPSGFDRVIAARFGAAAVRALAAGASGVMVALGPEAIELVPLREVAGRTRTVPAAGDTIATARELGICLGDEAPGAGATGV